LKTVIDNMEEFSSQIEGLLRVLLLEHSTIYRWNDDRDSSVVFISIRGDYGFRELDEAGRQSQSKLLMEYRHFLNLLKALLKVAPQDALSKLDETSTILLRTIEHEVTWSKTTSEALQKAEEALRTQTALLKRLFSLDTGRAILVPDTNALLFNATLERWRFPELGSFSLALTPTVLSELDALKINHRNEEVRAKAEGLINQIKEFRRRGRLTDGVVLVRDVSSVFAIVVEPDMESSLPWLDRANNDDRFLASVLEVMRSYPRSTVAGVSRDINLANKAEFARIPLIEPPSP
jgi:hypothetical protein